MIEENDIILGYGLKEGRIIAIEDDVAYILIEYSPVSLELIGTIELSLLSNIIEE